MLFCMGLKLSPTLKSGLHEFEIAFSLLEFELYASS
jgi:hypothetical protein